MPLSSDKSSYSRVLTWVAFAEADVTPILRVNHDTHDADMATALSTLAADLYNVTIGVIVDGTQTPAIFADAASAGFIAAPAAGAYSHRTTAQAQAQLSVDDVITLTGVSEGSSHLGTFTGATIADSSTIKTALQALETALEAITVGDAWGDAVDANIVPDADGTRDVGASATRFANVYTDALDVTNAAVIGGGVNVTGNIVVSGTVDGRDVATDGTKLDGVEAAADVTDEANVVAALDGATLTSATVATGDKVLIQDVDASDALKYVTAQSIADLAAGGAWQYIATATASTSSSLSFTDLDATYIAYKFVLVHISPTTNASIYIRTSTNNGSSYDSTAADYFVGYLKHVTSTVSSAHGTDTEIELSGTQISSADGGSLCGEVTLYKPSDATVRTRITGYVGHYETTGSSQKWVTAFRNSVADVDAVQFFPSTSTIASGFILLYGLKAS